MNESLSPSQLNLQVPGGVRSIHLRRHVFGVIAKYGTIIGMFSHDCCLFHCCAELFFHIIEFC
jgi:hypothetical protein